MLDLNKIPEAVRYEGGVSRRLFVAYASALAALPSLASRATAAERSRSFSSDPFSLGVASGDPTPRSVVLWTKLAPTPEDPDGGMPAEMVSVDWEIAEDDQMKKIVAKGSELATPQLGHSIHATVRGLKPDRWYWYRFRTGDAESPIGRTRTMPAASSTPQQLDFAFASCQHYETGLFTAYEHMAADELDLVFHLGDYIYEYPGEDGRVRKHTGPSDTKLKTLADYRQRHMQYRADPLLQAMHARCPWLLTWDDHEFDNNYAAGIQEEKGDGTDPVSFLTQRAAAYQAYYEMMPLSARCLPRGPEMKLYRTSNFGNLAEFFVLDTRQYRTDQPNGDGLSPLNEDALCDTNSLLGKKQRRWLDAGLITSTATWNVLAQQVMMGMVEFKLPGRLGFSMDQWPSCAYERMSLLEFMKDRKVPNPVVLTGDIHSNWVNNLRVDDRRGEDEPVATEFVTTSITSGGNGSEDTGLMKLIQSNNPCVEFFNRERGYVRCRVTPESWTSDYIVVEDVTKPGGNILKRASFVVEAGKPGAAKA